MKTQKSVGILTVPIPKSGLVPLTNLIDIIYSIFGPVLVITGGAGYDCNKNNSKVKIYRVSHCENSFYLTRIFFYILVQLKISWCIIKNTKNVDLFVFFFGGDTLVLPAITTWVLRKKFTALLGGSTIKILESKNDRLSYGLMVLRFITLIFAEKIIVYSDDIIHDYSLERWSRKIAIAQRNIINRDFYKIKKDYSTRELIVGYCGRFNEEKGILKLLHSIPYICNRKQGVKFLIIGDGFLQNELEQYIFDNDLSNRIILLGWMDHEFLPDYLNQMKLLVIPSDTEGLPNIMLEAMACGTPVLATPVGAIPDIIKDGETGFIMANNSPECIEENVRRALNSPDLGKIAENGRRFVEKKYVFEKTVEQWKRIFQDIK